MKSCFLSSHNAALLLPRRSYPPRDGAAWRGYYKSITDLSLDLRPVPPLGAPPDAVETMRKQASHRFHLSFHPSFPTL